MNYGYNMASTSTKIGANYISIKITYKESLKKIKGGYIFAIYKKVEMAKMPIKWPKVKINKKLILF